MKRVWLVLTVLMISLLPLCATAQGLEQAEAIQGVRCFPEGADEENASYVFRYAYPQFTAITAADESINAYYRAVAQDMTGTLFEQSAAESGDLPEGFGRAECQIDYQIARNDERYLSVLVTAQQMAGNGVSEALTAQTFARDGLYAGQPILLSQVLGLEQEGGGQSVAEALAYRLVWQIVQAEMENVEGDYLDGVSEETLQSAFSPETDFYLDEDGNVVFFIQPGIVTGEVAGTLRFPFAPEEMLSAVQELNQ